MLKAYATIDYNLFLTNIFDVVSVNEDKRTVTITNKPNEYCTQIVTLEVPINRVILFKYSNSKYRYDDYDKLYKTEEEIKLSERLKSKFEIEIYYPNTDILKRDRYISKLIKKESKKLANKIIKEKM